MKYIILILLLLLNLSFAGEIENIDARVVVIDARIAAIVVELVPIDADIVVQQDALAPHLVNKAAKQAEIDAKQAEIDAKQIQVDAAYAPLRIKNDELEAKQLEIDAALPEDKPALQAEYDQIAADIIPLQNAFNIVNDEMVILMDAMVILVSDMETIDALIVPIQVLLDGKVAEKQALLNEDNILDVEKASLLERKRKLQWIARVKALPDVRLCMTKAGFDIPNAELWVTSFIEANNEAPLLALEAQAQAVIDELAAEESKSQADITIRRVMRDFDPDTINSTNAVNVLKNVVKLLKYQYRQQQ